MTVEVAAEPQAPQVRSLVNSQMSRGGGVVVVVFGLVGVVAFSFGLSVFPPFAPMFIGGAMIFSLVILAGLWGMAGRFREEITFDVAADAVRFDASGVGLCSSIPLSQAVALRTRAAIAVSHSGGSGSIDTVGGGTSGSVHRRTVYLLSLVMRDGGELWISNFGNPDDCRREVQGLAELTGLSVDDRTQHLHVGRAAVRVEGPQEASASQPGASGDLRLSLPPSTSRPLRNAITVGSALVFGAFPAYVLVAFGRASGGGLAGLACMLCPLSVALIVWTAFFLKLAQSLSKRTTVELDEAGLRLRKRATLLPFEWRRRCDAQAIRRVELDRGQDGVFYLALVVERTQGDGRSLLGMVWDWVMVAPIAPVGPGFFGKKEEHVALWTVDYRNQCTGPSVDDMLEMKERIRGHLRSLR